MGEDIHWKNFTQRFKVYEKLIPGDPLVEPGMIICIPAYAEPDLLVTLRSLHECAHPGIPVEVIILFNQDDRMTPSEFEMHRHSYQSCLNWIASIQQTKFGFHPVWLEKKDVAKWGVGWARKLLMDEAARRLPQNGVIVNLDADCNVDKNYLQAIHQQFNTSDCDALSIYVEHVYENENAERKQWIIDYELHLRYLVHAKRWAGHPFAYQTFGSAMAVRRDAYLKQGGMNTRQAGEDFYFLQKFIETGKLEELKTTTVYPSCRTSLRVPFGTGKAMYDLETNALVWKTTSFETFELIRPLLTQLEKIYDNAKNGSEELTYSKMKTDLQLKDNLLEYLETIDWVTMCYNLVGSTSSYVNFEKRLFRKFNAFAFIRFMHEMRTYGYEDVEVLLAARQFLTKLGMPDVASAGNEDCLLFLRKLDREEKLS